MKDRNISAMIGHVLGIIFVACGGTCLAAIAIALTLKFIMLLF